MTARHIPLLAILIVGICLLICLLGGREESSLERMRHAFDSAQLTQQAAQGDTAALQQLKQGAENELYPALCLALLQQGRLGKEYRNEKAALAGFDHALELAREAADAGDYLAACVTLGLYYHCHHIPTQKRMLGIRKWTNIALELTRKAAEDDDPLAAALLAMAYQHGLGTTEQKREASHWKNRAKKGLEQQAEQNSVAAALLSLAYDKGWLWVQDAKQSQYWAQEAQKRAQEEERPSPSFHQFRRLMPHF